MGKELSSEWVRCVLDLSATNASQGIGAWETRAASLEPRATRVTGHWRNQETTLHPITSLRYLSDQGESKCPASARWPREERKICVAREGSTTKTFQVLAHRGNSSTRAGSSSFWGASKPLRWFITRFLRHHLRALQRLYKWMIWATSLQRPKRYLCFSLFFFLYLLLCFSFLFFFFLFTQLFFLH